MKIKEKNQAELSRSPAYCRGFVDGFEEGVCNNQFKKDVDRYYYDIGYEAGVAVYCETEDQNQN